MSLSLNPRRLWPSSWLLILLFALIAVSLLPQAAAFGAGNVPSFSHHEGSAFRHGDLADTLSALLKKSGGGLFGGKNKWGGLDIKRVYFGNWLRDYSQAMDVAGLEKLSKQTILSIVMVLSFLAHGYATGEFEVTEERLGVYLPTEHLDNPKGYPSNAKQYDSRLRGPVDPRELEIDPRSGMKNYLANESGGWATSSQLVRETVIQVVQLGREARQTGRKETLHDAYRHLGKVMHCLEDFPAHSNFCELALLRLGHRQVFCHVGDNVKVRSPSGEMVPCLVTGSFGGMDFVASMLGETSDHLSSASVSDLSHSINKAKQKQSQGNALSSLMGVLGKLPIPVGGNVSRDAEELSRGPATDPATMNPQEIYSGLFAIFTFHDRVMMSVETTIEKIPGLDSLLDLIGNSLATFTMTLIEPFVKPLISSALSGLHATSGAVVSGVDQYEVFNDPNASDPTHTQLAKDHFNLILNEVAGKVAIIIDRHVVNTIVASWDDGRDPRQVADECLAPMFHPYWQHRQSAVQAEILDYIASWANSHHRDIQRLTKQHCRDHTNTRSGKAETHQSCGTPSLAGVSQQSLGFGPAMANWVGGKVGLPGSSGGSAGKLGSFLRREAPDESSGEQRPYQDYNTASTTSRFDDQSNQYQSHGSAGIATHVNPDFDRSENSFPDSSQFGAYGHQPQAQYNASGDQWGSNPQNDGYTGQSFPDHSGSHGRDQYEDRYQQNEGGMPEPDRQFDNQGQGGWHGQSYGESPNFPGGNYGGPPPASDDFSQRGYGDHQRRSENNSGDGNPWGNY